MDDPTATNNFQLGSDISRGRHTEEKCQWMLVRVMGIHPLEMVELFYSALIGPNDIEQLFRLKT
jgi:hypothetical protein